MLSDKILPYEHASETFESLRANGSTIVQCHGTFDLVHPGHIYHFEEAKAMGDILVVTITADAFVNKGPGRPYFNELHRANSLAALQAIDYVVVIPFPAAVEAIECVRPDIYCKGKEYENQKNDVTGNIKDDLTTVEKYGGKIKYVGSIVFSSTRLLNNHFDHIDDSVKIYCKELSKECSPEKFRETIDSFSDLKVLIIGDIIFDRYSFVNVQGLTSKNRILSARFLEEETQAGGTLAIYRHVEQFCPNVKLLSLTGTEPWLDEVLSPYIPAENNLSIRHPSFTTIIKQRFVEPLHEGKELTKLFSINYINSGVPTEEVQSLVLDKLKEEVRKYDLVMVADFGHGLLQEQHRRYIEENASFMALNCQTNSNNLGFNIINHQYKRADAFTLDQNELLLATAKKYVNYTEVLSKLKDQFYSNYGWLTRGDVETIGLRTGEKPAHLLPLERVVTDTVGAGDAFYSVAALAAKKKVSIRLATFIGQLAGGQAVKIVGNQHPISKAALLKGGMSMLTF